MPAPADTPIVPGSAKGFLITDCNTAPDADSDEPINIASITRGKRRFITTILTVDFSLLKSALTICLTLYAALPTFIATKATRAINITKIIQIAPVFITDVLLFVSIIILQPFIHKATAIVF